MTSLDTFYRQQHTRILAELLEAEYPELSMLNGDVIPLDTEFTDTDDTYEFSFITKLGSAALIAGCASDTPRVTAFIDRRAGRFQKVGNHYSFCKEDLRKAQKRGVNLSATDALVAQEILKQTADQNLMYGMANAGLYGLLSQPNATIVNLPADGQLGLTPNSFKWADKTAEQILRDLSLIANTPRNLSNYIMWHDTIYLSMNAFDKVSQAVAPGVTSGETLMSFFLKTQAFNPKGVRRILPMPILGGEGVGGADLVISLNSREGNIKAVLVPGVQVEEYTQGKDLCTELSHSLGSVIQLKNLALQYASV